MVIQTNRISPNLNDTEKTVKAGVSVPNAMDGRFSNNIWDYTMDCTVQKETGKSSVYTEAQARQLQSEEAELPEDGGISPSAFINSCMTGEDFKDLSEEETPLEEYTSSQVERAVSRVKKQRTKKQEAVDGEVEKQQERQESLERHLQDKAPVTEENLSRLSHAVSMVAELSDFSDASMKFFIGSGRTTISPESIRGSVMAASGENVKAMHNSDGYRGNRLSGTSEEDTFVQMENQVCEILDEGGVAVTEETLEVARTLYENNLPVTAENVKIYEALTELKELDPSVLLARIVDNMAEGISPEKADLTKISADEAAELVENLVTADDATLRKTYTTEADFIRAKRQLEEIRLTMTVEAARTMASKGIEIDVTNLEEIVEELKLQEQQATEELLRETGVPVTEKHTQVMGDTLACARQVLAAPVEMLGATRPFFATRSLQEMGETAAQYTAEKLEQTYEAVGTEVRPDLGDRISKAFQNVDDILRELNLELTGANQRAVRILAYNRMPLTEENILDMKAYDSKVTTLMESLKPPVVAELIKKQINPLNLTLEELDESVKEIVQENTPAEDISFRKYLWKMDRQRELTPQERESMIGIYRLLDKVEKSDGAVIGQVIKEGKELSFASLLSATRSRRAAGLDVSVDDAFGGLSDTVAKGTSISDQIQAAYGSTLVSKLQKNLSPKVLRELDETGMDISLEALLEKCVTDGETDQEMSAYYEQMAGEIRAAAEDADGRLNAFLRALEMPDTMSNLVAAKQMFSSRPGRYEKLWTEEESEEVTEMFDNPDELDEIYEKIDRTHTEELAKEKESDDITYDGIATLAKMAGSISFYQNLRQRQMYEIPLVTEQGITNCHITIQSGDRQEKGTVEITMESEVLGKMQATFRVNDRHVKGFVTAENQEGMEMCRQILDEFEKDLEEMGFAMDSESLVQGSRHSLQTGNRSEGTKNQDLYRIAKAFIVHAKKGKDVSDEN